MQVNAVAVFHCTSCVGSAWGCAEGIVTSLAALGYRVLDCGNPRVTTTPIEALQGVDLIVMSAVEWYDQVLLERYGIAWFDLMAPKVAWYAESASRDDRTFPFNRCRPLADRHYFPAIQDADEFRGEWLPFGADTAVFNPKSFEKRFDAVFLGQLYPKRQEYVRHVGYPLQILPAVSDGDLLRGFHLLAEAYSSARIFVNLPSYSRLLVTKVTEVMACRTMLITPAVDHPSGIRNMAQFKDGEHLVYYQPDRPQDIGRLVEYYLSHPDERDAIATAGWQEITRGHTLRHRMQKIVSDVQSRAR